MPRFIKRIAEVVAINGSSLACRPWLARISERAVSSKIAMSGMSWFRYSLSIKMQ